MLDETAVLAVPLRPAVERPVYQRLEDGRLGVVRLRAGEEGGLRVVCFPFAGGGPLAFQALATSLPASWAVWAVDPPGHVRTAGEPLWTVEEMVALYARALPASLLEGALLVGHSLGGYVAVGLAEALAREGRPVAALVVGAAQPPHLRDPSLPLTNMSDEELFEWVSSLGGLPASLGDQREFFELYREAIRADVVAFEAFRMPTSGLPGTPVLGLAGLQDPIYPSGVMGEWGRCLEQLWVETTPGAHLFVLSEPEQIARRIAAFAAARNLKGASHGTE